MARAAGLACALFLAMPLPAWCQQMVFPSAVQPPPQNAPAPYGNQPAPYYSLPPNSSPPPPAPGPFVPLQGTYGGLALPAGSASVQAPGGPPPVAQPNYPGQPTYAGQLPYPGAQPGYPPQAPGAAAPQSAASPNPASAPASGLSSPTAPAPYVSPYARPVQYSPSAVYSGPAPAQILTTPTDDANLFPSGPRGPVTLPPPGSRWSIEADALWLQRSTGNFGSLGETILAYPVTAVQQLNVGGFGMQPGMRLKATYRADDWMSWEAIYFGLQQWSSSGIIYGDPSRYVDYDNGPLLATSPYTETDAVIGPFDSSMGYTYVSSLNNAELNQRMIRVAANSWVFDTLVGFRFVEWNERFQLNSANYPAASYNAVYYQESDHLSTHNTLLGAQLGYGLRRDWDRLSMQFNGKAALMANIIRQTYNNLNSTLYLNNGYGGAYPGFIPYSLSNTTLGVSGVLDFSAIATFQVTPNFSLRGGYQVLYIPGLALAPSQLSGWNHNQGALLQGPSAGMTVQW